MKPSDGKVLLSEDTAGIGEVGQAGNVENDNLKLVPLSESVRYRKRAQSAEKKIEDLVKQLAEAKAETKTTAEQLRQVQVEQKLVHKLTAAGTVDLDTAMLIAKTRMEGETEADMDSVIKRLRKEKQYLFAGAGGTTGTKRTAGAKERTEGGQVVLDGKLRIIAPETGLDVTRFHVNGAKHTLEIANIVGARRAYLKGGSPSCDREGVTGEMLKRGGIKVIRVP